MLRARAGSSTLAPAPFPAPLPPLPADMHRIQNTRFNETFYFQSHACISNGKHEMIATCLVRSPPAPGFLGEEVNNALSSCSATRLAAGPPLLQT